MTTPSPDCPDCGAPLSPVRLARCPRCRLPLLGTDAAALRQVTTALRAVEQSRLTLLHQREVLLGLRARRPRTDPPCVGRLGPRPGWDWQLMPATLAGLWLLVGALAVLALRRPAASLEAATATAAVPALALLPVACGLPYGFAITAAVAMAPAIPLTATLTLIVRGERPATTVGLTVAPGLALLWALADRAATITVLGVLAALALLLTVRVPRGATAAVEPLLLGAEAVAVGAAAGLALPDIALAVLAVTIGSAPVAARTSGEVSRAVELTGYGLASCAALLTTRQPSRLSFVLAVAGVAALGIALGPSRRHAPGIASALLLIASPWVRLALSQVHTPEAYTLTLASAALVLGHLHRRRRPETDSWTAYGAGLGDAQSARALDGRPLAAPAAARLGGPDRHPPRRPPPTPVPPPARRRHPAAGRGARAGAHRPPTPRPAPPLGPLATAGLLLLILGATYEHRLRDAVRRLQ